MKRTAKLPPITATLSTTTLARIRGGFGGEDVGDCPLARSVRPGTGGGGR